MEITRAKYFSVQIDDKAGQIAVVATHLLEEKVDLFGIWGFGLPDGSANVVVVPRDPAEFPVAAEKTDWNYEEGTCFRVSAPDHAGWMVEILNKIAEPGIVLTAFDAVGVAGKFAGYVWPKDEDVEKVARILEAELVS